jgi:hypothetical protein
MTFHPIALNIEKWTLKGKIIIRPRNQDLFSKIIFSPWPLVKGERLISQFQ